MSASIEFNVSLDTTILDAILEDMAAAGQNLRKPLTQAGVYMHGSIERNFRAQGRPVRWKQLSQRTLSQRRRGGGAGNPRILQDTGILRASVTSRRAKGSIFRLTPDSLTIGTNVSYAGTHQHGRGPIPNVRQNVRSHRRRTPSGGYTTVRAHTRTVTLPGVPARPFLLFQAPEDVDAITQLFARHCFDEPMKAAGKGKRP